MENDPGTTENLKIASGNNQQNEHSKPSIREEASTLLPTHFGDLQVRVFSNGQDTESIAIVSTALDPQSDVAVRVHSACLTAEVLGSMKCDCKSQLDYALQYIADNQGMVIYLPQEGRGVGLVNKIRAYALQEQGMDTVDANRALGLPDDARDYSDAAIILSDLGVKKIRLLTNNPAKVSALKALGIDVVERIPLPLMANKHSSGYLNTKRKRMGHLLEIGDESETVEALSQQSLRPIVHVNFALDREGNAASESGKPVSLSCKQDWQRVHELREYYSAVVVGARTWKFDKPQLTVRQEYLGREPHRQPERVIFSGGTACNVQPDGRRTFVIGSSKSSDDVVRIEARNHNVKSPLQALRLHGIESVLVEGGLTLIRSFIREEQIDQLTIYVCADSGEQAAKAIAIALPELVQDNLQFEKFGEGILVSCEAMP